MGYFNNAIQYGNNTMMTPTIESTANIAVRVITLGTVCSLPSTDLPSASALRSMIASHTTGRMYSTEPNTSVAWWATAAQKNSANPLIIERLFPDRHHSYR